MLPPSLRKTVSWTWRCWICRKGPLGSYICSCLRYPRSWRGRTGCSDTWGVLCFRARGGCPFRGRIRPYMGQISSHTTGICPLSDKSNPCRLGKGYTPRTTTRSPLSGVTAGNYLPWPSGWGGALWVPILGDNPGIITTTPVQILQTNWLPSKDPGTVNEHNALPVTHEWLHCSLITEKWPEMLFSSSRMEKDFRSRNTLEEKSWLMSQKLSWKCHSLFSEMSLKAALKIQD